ncbi:adenylate/guanylate cyclase domain-containing protein [Mesorhizobium sp. M1E.F.Ca.ET.045.02.1.1]|nr:adenylate/guanylate cyclase domain-containing protein [Mesorhizobium sp. M1E.F.Ca.ET.045.02.1.1]RUW36397.1 alpha/beta fold hydrolase [Mesorhizobium sp. M1E.F.Ca.ET.041.01.1.1]RUW86338.1 alpha/beta fold hydrolase [Mesorhizobium sp. M1E.F.Ca.ET.063.01.1.1]RWD91727.1 MAG: alpha/beta fold hydrolase [Mesorhizobium sp.]TIV55663.1 MAG: adenylate/guanylate cyclase domain-containing protein [Mesorhizobium sp.]
MTPRTKYARSGDVAIAYQVWGSGPVDLVWAPGTASHLDLEWEMPLRALFFEKLGAFCRVIKFDKRGTGLSDRPIRMATLEERADDIRAVIDAEKVERASLFGVSEGGSMTSLFAALNPDRVRSLIVWGTQARWCTSDDHPWGMSSEAYDQLIKDMAENGPSDEYIRGAGVGLGRTVDQTVVDAFARHMRAAASPSAHAAYEAMNRDIDIRNILPTISVPTLVMNRTQDPVASVEAARDMARRIPQAEMKEYPGDTHTFVAKDMDTILADIQSFLTGVTPEVASDRKLAAILFLDVVSSTDQLARDGDQSWSNTLTSYYNIVRKEIARYRGEEFTVAGDGFLALFDGPARAVRCALTIAAAVKQLEIDVRAGVHVGECAIVGANVTGLAIHTGARIMSSAEGGMVLTSQTVRDLVAGSGLRFSDQGERVLKGVPDKHRLFLAMLEDAGATS